MGLTPAELVAKGVLARSRVTFYKIEEHMDVQEQDMNQSFEALKDSLSVAAKLNAEANQITSQTATLFDEKLPEAEVKPKRVYHR